jgi:nuclear transport factor 2 (NTF2) superfamily protein
MIDRERAASLVQATEAAFARADVAAIIAGFTDDVIIRFADLPEIRGQADAEKFLCARFARQKNYQLKKSLRMVEGSMIGNFWEGTWEDARTGAAMRGRGTEFWTLRDGKVAVWEATFNVWEEAGGPSIPIL